MYILTHTVVLWEQTCPDSGLVDLPQCKNRVCTASNDIAKIGLATEALGSPGQHTELALRACRGREADVQLFWRKLQ